MSLISKCPKCRQQVTIPDGLDADAEVRCPLCAVVYPLSEALADAPPALIPVDTGAIRGPGPDSDAMLKSDLVSEPFHVPESDDASKPSQAETEPPADEGPALDVWQKVDEAPEIDTGAVDEPSPAIDARLTPVDRDALAVFAIKESEDEHEPVDKSPLKHRRKRKKEKSAARLIMEVFVGGFVGLAIGYYVLCWVWGSQHGLPELPLPFLPHTMHWWTDAEKPDNDLEQPAAEEPTMPKRQLERRPQSPEPSLNENQIAQPDIPPEEPPPEEPE